MSLNGISLIESIKVEQTKGYAKGNLSSDIDGYDAVYKLAILASLAFETKVNYNCIYREGIGNISSADIEYVKKFGYTIKLLAIAKLEDNKLELRVHPALVPSIHPMANVNNAFNGILIKGNAVVGDIISILRNNVNPSDCNHVNTESDFKEIKKSEENRSKFYIRFNVEVNVEILGDIVAIFSQNNVSIISINQQIMNEANATLELITNIISEKNIGNSL